MSRLLLDRYSAAAIKLIERDPERQPASQERITIEQHMWVAGRGQAWGWMVGSAVQPGWIAYALLTNQLGFVIGCAISTGVQLFAYLRASGSAGRAAAIPIAVRRSSRLELPAESAGHPA